MLASLARFAPSVLGKVADYFIPGAGEAVRRIHQWYTDKRSAAEKAEILRALNITEEKLNAFDRMFILLGRDCQQLLERVDALEKQGRDSADEIARAVLAAPELQERFDSLGLAVSLLEADVRRLDENYASLSAFAKELKVKQLTDTELADFRAFRQAKQFQAAGNFAESEPILLKLANSQPQSAAVAVALAVAQHDQPQAFDASLKRAVRLRPDDANLRALASAATVAVTGRNTPSVRPTPPVGRVPKLGDTLDGWALEHRLGGGGWGIVFRASKRGAMKAVKVMRPDLSDHAEFVEAFHEEALKLNRLRHANVVAVERIGFCRDFQCPYFVMPLLDGLTLESHLDRHGVPQPDTAMGWLTGLLDGLDHAHFNGLIHRDVKPANVIIQPDGRAVLIDFGIAGLDGVAGHTQAMGMSRQFAPPEQVSAGAADLRADLYSLAATIFYALRYDHPADRLAHEYEAELVPEPFRAAFDAALSRKPSKRPSNAMAMRGMLTVERCDVNPPVAPPLPAAPQPERLSPPAQASGLGNGVEVAPSLKGSLTEDGATLTGSKPHLADPPGRSPGLKETALRAEDKPPTAPAVPQVPRVRKAGDQKTIELGSVRTGAFLGFGGKDVSVTMTFAWCPPGTFLMGSPESEKERRDNETQHEVTLTKGFWMGIHPVTQAQYRAVMGSNPSEFRGDERPVEQVTWEDAVKFCATLKDNKGVELRLPTEAEWEYAARGGTSTPFYWGGELNGSQANCCGNISYGINTKGPFRQKTTPVGSFDGKHPHPWGLCDVIGNVSEWCADKYDSGYYGMSPKEDPAGPESGIGRVLRGGCWYFNAHQCRAAYRGVHASGTIARGLGFRVAADESALSPAG